MTNPFAQEFDALEGGERFVTQGRDDHRVGPGLVRDAHRRLPSLSTWTPPGPPRSRFGERIAHGMLVLSYAIGLLPIDPERVVALRRVSDVVFKHPVYIGDTIHVEGRLESATEIDAAHGLVESHWKVVTQRERTALRARMEVVWRRSAVPAEIASELVMPL